MSWLVSSSVPPCQTHQYRAGVLAYAMVDEVSAGLSRQIDKDAHDVFFESLSHGFTSAAAFQVRGLMWQGKRAVNGMGMDVLV